MGLKEYKSRRKFGRTPEPKPGKETLPATPTYSHSRSGEREGKSSKALEPGDPGREHLGFVIHKHAARRLHYDLRLELKGVLKSWAVPKGPSLNPSSKRLAIMVEDHPLAYKDFEGVIPEGNYGAGNVIIWDRGFYSHPSAPDRKESEKLLMDGLKKGKMKFVLAGEKLKGEFALIKTGKDEKSWLLLKKKDRYAVKDDILRKRRSVISGKTVEQVSGVRQDKPFRNKNINRIRLQEAMESEDLKDLPLKPIPHRVKPMLATLVKKPFDHPDWIFEVKWDGYRAISEISEGKVSLYSRNLTPLNQKFPSIAEPLRKFKFQAVLDGEIVAVDDQGRPDFQMLQNYRKSGKGHLLYYVFDLLYFQGHDLTGLPLIRRRELLIKILPPSPKIKFSDHVSKEGVLFFKAAREKGLEGMMAKHSQSSYRMGRRSRQWLKVKSHLTQEGVIAGFTKPRGGRKYFGSLLLGVYEGDELIYIGHSGGGFGTKDLKEIREKLDPLVRDGCPFKVEPKSKMHVTWVKPKLVCEVVFQGWTDEGIMRQPVFLRMREDKAAREVVKESFRSAFSRTAGNISYLDHI